MRTCRESRDSGQAGEKGCEGCSGAEGRKAAQGWGAGASNADPGLEHWNFMSQGVPGVTLFPLPSPVGGELLQAEDEIGRVPICVLLLVFVQGFPSLEAQMVKNRPAIWETWV